MNPHLLLAASLLCILGITSAFAQKPIKVFILAGDENMLRTGSIDGVLRGPGAAKVNPEEAAAKPATLHKIVHENPRYATLGNPQDSWAARNDVALYDAHPLYNNIREPARLLTVPTDENDPRGVGVGVDLMFGHIVGEATNDSVLLIRFATNEPIWFRRGSRSLGFDYLSPTGGGGLDLDAECRRMGKPQNLNGQEYLELIDSIKTVFADSASPAFSAAYGRNLKGLIQDVRKEFNAPDLPFVVAALGQHDDKMSAGQRAGHTAQMAIASELPHVVSIDTVPSYFPSDHPPRS